MKNNLFTKIFFILCFFSLNFNTQAFFGESEDYDLYKNLEKNYNSLQSWAYNYELTGKHSSIKDKLNSLINQRSQIDQKWFKDCFEQDLAPSHIEAIAHGDISILYKKIWDNCKDSSGNIQAQTISYIQTIIENYYIESQVEATEKIELIWDISSLGIYADGSLENSSFDLIEDLERINDIIFASKFEYSWVENDNYKDIFNDILDTKKSQVAQEVNDPKILEELLTWEKAYSSDVWGSYIEEILSHTQNTNACFDPSSWDHGIDLAFAQWWITLIDDKSLNKELYDDLVSQNESNWNTSSGAATTEIWWNYESVNDNSQWPCDSFYCITVNFKTYNHQLLGWWDNITIEYLIDRSNQHLRRFANASLIPAKMTTNNFELGLTNLDLSELFHMWFQIQTKPVPILKVNKSQDENSPKDKHSTQALLEKYYKAYWLDYQRRNDLDIFTKKQQELSSLIQSSNVLYSEATQRIQELENYKNEKNIEIDLLKKDIWQKYNYTSLNSFQEQLIEIRNFTKSIEDYSHTLNDLIVAMQKIKSDW